MSISLLCRCLPLALIAIAACSIVVRAETRSVEIETHDGRTLTGEVDERTDGKTLWLRRTEGNVILATSVDWARIANAEIDGESIEVAILQSERERLATAAPASFLTEFELLEPLSPVPRLDSWHRQHRVTNIEVDAALINLDRTVEADGLLLALAVFDDQGQAVHVRGTLAARLIVERLDQHTGAVSFEEFQRWSASVLPLEFHEGIAELPLRFRRESPEFRWDLCIAALLNVRLGVPGQGNYEASVPVAIQEFNPIRDEMRNQQGSRFFRNELTRNTLQDGPKQLHRGYSAPRRYGF